MSSKKQERDDAELSELLTFDPEKDDGNCEYKYKLTNLTENQMNHLAVQLKFRLDEGAGEAIYEIGLRDDGFPVGLTSEYMDQSLANLAEIAESVSAKICFVNRRPVGNLKLPTAEQIKANVIEMEAQRKAIAFKLEHADDVQKSRSKRGIRYGKVSDSAATNKQNLGEDNETKSSDSLTESAEQSDTSAATSRSEAQREVAEVLIRENNVHGEYLDIRLAVAGNVDAAKSSTVGVLIKGVLDNGNGSARLNVFNHKHEITSGRTSSIAQQILGFDNNGEIVNAKFKVKAPSWKEIVEQSSKIITIFDLAGHEKYLKTTITGFSQNDPDYCMMMVGANMGLTHMTREHMILCLSLKVPFFMVMSKMDIAPENIIKETYEKMCRLLKLPGVRKIPFLVKTLDDAVLCSKNMVCDNVVPIFQVSNVTGMNLDHLRVFLNCLPPRKRDFSNEKVRYRIHEVFSVEGTGTVVSGLLTHGTVKVGDKLLLGPDRSNQFTETLVKSIECKRVRLSQVSSGLSVCFALRKVARSDVKKGMVLLSPALKPVPIWDFEAEITIIHSHSTAIKCGYTPMLHIDNVRQVAEIVKIIKVQSKKERLQKEKEKDKGEKKETGPVSATAATTSALPTTSATSVVTVPSEDDPPKFQLSALKTGDKATVYFKFMFHPEWFEEGSRLIFREGKTKGTGLITKIYENQERRQHLGRRRHRHHKRNKKVPIEQSAAHQTQKAIQKTNPK